MKQKGRMGAGKIHAKSGTPLGGNNAGSNVMLAKNTAGSMPLQPGKTNLGQQPMIRVPSTLKSGRGR